MLVYAVEDEWYPVYEVWPVDEAPAWVENRRPIIDLPEALVARYRAANREFVSALNEMSDAIDAAS